MLFLLKGGIMKAVIYCMMASLFMLTTSLKADLEVWDVCTVSADQVDPDIDGDWIVWQDARNGTANNDIYGYTLAEPNEVAICTASGNQKYAAVSGNIAVWQDERSSQRDIYAFDLLARADLDLPNMPRTDSLSQRYPDISGEVIVYRHEPGGSYNLYTYDMTSQAPSLMHTSSQSPLNFAIDGDLVVWMEQADSVYQIFMKDFSQADPAVRISETTYGQWFPAVSGTTIVWAENRGTETGMDLYGFDAANPGAGEFVVYSGSGEQNRPSISGTLVVWQDQPDGQSDCDIRGLDLSGGGPFEIATGTDDDQKPAISGRTVVWQRDNTDWDIVRAEIPAPQVAAEILVTLPQEGQMVLASRPMEIAWQWVDGPAPDAVEIAFSSDDGQTWPVSVASDIPFESGSYWWDSVADVNSLQCRISVTATDDASVTDTSERFTVFQCDKDLTADVTGDCFVGLDDFAEMAAQWLTCGNPHDETWCFD